GEADRALNLSRKTSAAAQQLPHAEVVQLAIAELRALSQLRLDYECLERVQDVVGMQSALGPLSEFEFGLVRTIEGEALWHLNRITEARNLLMQTRAELLSRPSHLATAACSATLAAALISSGSWLEGRNFALEGLVLARRVGSRFYEGFSHSLL